MTNWPNPERDGWHFLQISGIMIALHWRPLQKSQEWVSPMGILFSCAEFRQSLVTTYLGPCLTPTQIAEFLVRERMRCVRKAREISDKYYEQRASSDNDKARVYANERMCAAAECASAIRNLGAAP